MVMWLVMVQVQGNHRAREELKESFPNTFACNAFCLCNNNSISKSIHTVKDGWLIVVGGQFEENES